MEYAVAHADLDMAVKSLEDLEEKHRQAANERTGDSMEIQHWAGKVAAATLERDRCKAILEELAPAEGERRETERRKHYGDDYGSFS